MLYCPQCGAEYREGYSSCSDCHVLLVREWPGRTEQEPAPPPGDPNKDPFTNFWKGEDARIHAELCSLLEEAEIPHITIRREDHLFNITRQPQLQIAVPFSMMEKAESVVVEAFGEPLELPLPEGEPVVDPEEPTTRLGKFLRDGFERGLLPTILEKMRESRQEKIETEIEDEPSSDGRVHDPDDCHSAGATMEVWSGPEQDLAEMISVSLRENEIPSRQDEFKSSQVVYVEPKDEERAREIVREIVEATPPE
jgi:hypothetical protein